MVNKMAIFDTIKKVIIDTAMTIAHYLYMPMDWFQNLPYRTRMLFWIIIILIIIIMYLYIYLSREDVYTRKLT
jgi:hypothetical protein